MAKMRPGAIVGGASGSLGCVTVSPGQGGHVMRVRSRPCKVETEATARCRKGFATVSRGWGALSASQKAAWDVWGSQYGEVDVLGVARTLGGREAYCRLNSRLELAGSSWLTLPPSEVADSRVYTATLTASVGLTLPFLSVVGRDVSSPLWAFVWVAVKMGGGGRRWRDELKLCVRRSVAWPLTTVIFQQEYLDRWGPLIEGQRMWCVLRWMDHTTGLLSLPALASGVVTA